MMYYSKKSNTKIILFEQCYLLGAHKYLKLIQLSRYAFFLLIIGENYINNINTGVLSTID